MVQLSNDCYSPRGTLQSPAAALARLQEQYPRPIAAVVPCPIDQSVGRVVVEGLTAVRPVPHFANSAVDGFAFCYRDIEQQARTPANLSLPLTAHVITASAGAVPPLTMGQAVEIFTGGQIPQGADSVIMKEDITLADGRVIFPTNILEKLQRGDNVRQSGDDVGHGQELIKKGEIITPLHLGLFAAQGWLQPTWLQPLASRSTTDKTSTASVKHINVFQPLTITVFSSGDEVRPASNRPSNSTAGANLPASTPLAAGELFDSNRPMLISLLRHWGYRVIDGGIIGDQGNELQQRLAATDSDIVITSGGMSVGGRDLALPLLQQNQVAFYGLDIKPGRPMGVARIKNNSRSTHLATHASFPTNTIAKDDDEGSHHPPRHPNPPPDNQIGRGEALWLALPGNPVAVMMGVFFLVKPLLRHLQGAATRPQAPQTITADFTMKKKTGRQELIRVRLVDQQGEIRAMKIAKGGSAVLSSLAGCDGIMLLGRDVATVLAGERYDFYPLTTLLQP